MVYISSDGKVHASQPWSLSRFFSMFIRFFMAIALFLHSLIGPFLNPNRSSTSTGRRSFWGSGGSGGGYDGRPPRRPMGRITHLSDTTVPGGCPGGSCER